MSAPTDPARRGARAGSTRLLGGVGRAARGRGRGPRRRRRWPTRSARPGKRVRAALVLAAYRSAGGASPAIAGVAAAVETVHTYSLVHDDLPCMDDDDLRRGRPTTHRAFDVPTATRVGFLLVPVAARVLAVAAAELGLSAAALGRMADGAVPGRRHRGDGRGPVARPRGRAAAL